jgi:hypothetical protein
MLYAMHWTQRVLGGAQEVHMYTDYRYTAWIDDILGMCEGTVENLAIEALVGNVPIAYVFDLDVNGVARFLEVLIQKTALPVYYTRMVDTILLNLTGDRFRRYRRLVEKNRTQMETIMHSEGFEIQSVTGFAVGIDDILLIVETIVQELLPSTTHGEIFFDTEAHLRPVKDKRVTRA